MALHGNADIGSRRGISLCTGLEIKSKGPRDDGAWPPHPEAVLTFTKIWEHLWELCEIVHLLAIGDRGLHCGGGDCPVRAVPANTGRVASTNSSESFRGGFILVVRFHVQDSNAG